MSKITSIRVMADYSSTGLWDQNGFPIDLPDLPFLMPESLKDKLKKYVDMYEVDRYFFHGSYDNECIEDDTDARKLTQLGWEIAVEINAIVNKGKAAIDKINVVFYDELNNVNIYVDDATKLIKNVFDIHFDGYDL